MSVARQRRRPDAENFGGEVSFEPPSRFTSLDYFVRAAEERDRDCETERLGGLHVDDEFDFRRLLHRQVSRVLALEDAAGVDATETIRVPDTASVAHQTTGRCEFSKLEDRRYRVAERQRGELFGAAGEKGIRADRERAYAQLNQGSEDHVEVAFGAGMQDMGSQPERAGRRVHVSRLCLRNGRIG